jgi:hypothetical protein
VHPDITCAWVEKNYPLVRSEDMAMYVDGLAKAGLD